MDLQEIKSRIFKGKNDWNNYINVSIEEMDWLVKQAEKVEKAKETLNEILEWDNQKEVNKIVRDALKELNI